MAMSELDRIREIALALPEVEERISHKAPSFFIRGKKAICRFHDVGYNEHGRMSLWCPSPPGVRDELVTADPERFYAPTPSASGVFGGWIGVYLDTTGESAVDWQEIASIVEEAYRLQAPKTLLKKLHEHR